MTKATTTTNMMRRIGTASFIQSGTRQARQLANGPTLASSDEFTMNLQKPSWRTSQNTSSTTFVNKGKGKGWGFYTPTPFCYALG
jgi:hypothetical protein